MKALLNARLCRLFAHLVVLIGGALHVVERRILRAIEAWHKHLRQAEVFRPSDAVFLIFAQLLDPKV